MLKCGQRTTSPPRREREPLVLLSLLLSGPWTETELSDPGTGAEDVGSPEVSVVPLPAEGDEKNPSHPKPGEAYPREAV